MIKPSRVYVASSWRNEMQPAVVSTLRVAGIDCYDFKHPDGPTSDGFHWRECLSTYSGETCDVDDYLTGIDHPTAVAGYGRDFAAMESCDCCVLVLPCGRSAHLELGWFTGQGRRTAILMDGPIVVPELMYRLVDFIAPNLFELLGWLGVED